MLQYIWTRWNVFLQGNPPNHKPTWLDTRAMPDVTHSVSTAEVSMYILYMKLYTILPWCMVFCLYYCLWICLLLLVLKLYMLLFTFHVSNLFYIAHFAGWERGSSYGLGAFHSIQQSTTCCLARVRYNISVVSGQWAYGQEEQSRFVRVGSIRHHVFSIHDDPGAYYWRPTWGLRSPGRRAQGALACLCVRPDTTS